MIFQIKYVEGGGVCDFASCGAQKTFLNIESTEPDRAKRARLLVQLLFDSNQFKDMKHYNVDEQFDKIHEASQLIANSISISTAVAVVGALLGIASTRKWLK